MPGATEAERRAVRSEVWGEVKDSEGNTIVGTVFTPDAYTFTGLICLKAVEILTKRPQMVPVGVSHFHVRQFIEGLQLIMHSLIPQRRH